MKALCVAAFLAAVFVPVGCDPGPSCEDQGGIRVIKAVIPVQMPPLLVGNPPVAIPGPVIMNYIYDCVFPAGGSDGQEGVPVP